MGLFYAWDGMIRYQDGTARVNLLLNRASPWMDIDSYLPYEGKVVLKNKGAGEAFVRIPLWVDKKAVTCRIKKQPVNPAWFGNYLRFKDLKPSDEVTIQFPMVETVEKWTIPVIAPFQFASTDNRWEFTDGEQGVVTCRFKGNTLVEMTPRLSERGRTLYSHRGRFLKGKAPVKKLTRYVSPMVLKW
jgi:hypothetical protein